MIFEYRDGLETQRLVTRFITEADISAWLAYCSDPVAVRFTGIPGKSPEELARFMVETTMNRYSSGRYGLQVLTEKASGEMVGLCGLMIQEPGGKTEIEVGYHLLPAHWKKGYATEAAAMFLDYGFTNGDMSSIISIIDPLNEASQAVARRNGLHLSEREVEFRGACYDIYRIARLEWLSHRNSQ